MIMTMTIARLSIQNRLAAFIFLATERVAE